MHIQKLHIKSHFHLEDLEFDFTYPKDHKTKAGQPLDKICLIGQSATGKSTILNLLNSIIATFKNLNLIENKYINDILIKNEFKENSFVFIKDSKKLTLLKEKIIFGNDEYIIKSTIDSGSNLFDNIKSIYLTSELLSMNGVSVLSMPTNTVLHTENPNSKFNSDTFSFILNKEINEKFWKTIFFDIIEYRRKSTQLASELINNGGVLALESVTVAEKISEWKLLNKNPTEIIAQHFNPLLKIINLEIDLIDTNNILPVKSLITKNTIPFDSLSTGTKGLLLSLLPLIELNTDDSMILIDEPERSLFPDMQVGLMEHYQNIAPKAQFIVATHSPFIAAAFEDYERFILYFDEQGKVKVRKGKSPIGDDPNDILHNDFNVDYYNKDGKKAYQDYLNLKKDLFKEDDSEKKNEILLKLTAIGDKYNF